MLKELYQAELEAIEAEREKRGASMDGTDAGNLAMERARDRFLAMCDDAKDRAKERWGL